MLNVRAALTGFCALLLSLLPGAACAEEWSSTATQIAFADGNALWAGARTPAPEAVIQEIADDAKPIPTIDLTTQPDDLWQRVRNGFAMPNLANDLVTTQQVFYLNRPEYLKRVVERSRRYLHHIVEEIEKRGMPTELALLPIVESAYNPQAISPARASGLWQFIPSTGRNYGLEQNWWIDERRDIIASTDAALDYLSYIYELHGDWHLALASYNWGENAVGRAIARNQAVGRPTDYMSLSMPSETRNYVPKLQALKNIIAQPELFGIDIDPIPNRPYFATVRKPRDMDMAVAAQLAETPLDEFRALNPAYNRPVMRATGEASLVVPAEKVAIFLSNLENPSRPLVSWQRYTVGRKERLDHIAARFGMSSARLREVNGLSPNAKVLPGHTLMVPARGAPSLSAPVAGSAPAHSGGSAKPGRKTASAHKTAAKSAVTTSSGRQRLTLSARNGRS